jgi:hypothetical protein
MAIKVRNVEALKNHRLAVDFSNGTSGIADLSGHIERMPFLALKPERAFKEVTVDHGAVESGRTRTWASRPRRSTRSPTGWASPAR